MLTLTTYDQSGRIELRREDTSAVSFPKREIPANGKTYGINSTKIPDPESVKGLMIQNGKKVVR